MNGGTLPYLDVYMFYKAVIVCEARPDYTPAATTAEVPMPMRVGGRVINVAATIGRLQCDNRELVQRYLDALKSDEDTRPIRRKLKAEIRRRALEIISAELEIISAEGEE